MIAQTTMVLEKKREHDGCKGGKNKKKLTGMADVVVLDMAIVNVDLALELLKDMWRK